MPARLAAAMLVLFAVLAGAAPARAQDPIHWQGLIVAGEVAPGRTFTLELNVEIDDRWHLYAIGQPPGGPKALVFTLPPGQPFVQGGAIDAPAPRAALDPNFNIETQFHEERATFRIPVRVTAGTPPGPRTLRLIVSYQTCNDRLCLPPQDEELRAAVIVGGPAGSGTPLPPSRAPGSIGAEMASPERSVEPTAPATSTPARTPSSTTPARAPAKVVDMAESSHASTLGAYVALAALMGALSLLTPCVFPMVPITVSYFSNRSTQTGSGRRDAVTQALIYGLGIVLTFSALGLALALVFGASGVNQFAASPWLNLGITALFVGFALSLFGIYELALPSRLLTVLSAPRGGASHAGTLLMGLAFTLTSFTCTAPFLGTLLVVASQGNWQWPLAGMLAFSSVFALPFVILALAPQLIASLPRSGKWLLATKATMGLLELAAALKFLSNADLVWHWGLFTRPVVLTGWIVIAAILVLYLAGLFKIGHAPRLGRPRLGRLAAVAAGIVLGVWLASGLGGRRLGELEAFLPPADLAGAQHGELPWILNDYDRALADAARLDRPLLIDFTGYTCTNCRWMEANMFPRPEVSQALGHYIRVRLYTDGSGEPYRRYQAMEQNLFGTVALPYYAVLGPDGVPRVAFGGLTRNSSEFVAFLTKGLE